MKAERLRERICWLEPFWVLIIGAGLLLPQPLVSAHPASVTGLWRPLLIVLLLAGWPFRRLAYGRFTRRTPLDWPLLLLMLCIVVGLTTSGDKPMSWEAAGYLIVGLALYFALLNWPPAERRPQIVAWALMGFGLGIALLAPVMSRLTVAQFSRLPALGALLSGLGPQRLEDVNVNVLAGSLVLVLPLYASMALRGTWRTPWPRVGFALGALATLVVILVTRSRGAYLAAAVGVTVVFVLRWPRLRYVVLALIGLGLVGLVLVGPTRGIEMLSVNGALGGLNGRSEVWERALYALQDFALTGIGIGTFSRVIPLLYPYVTLAPDSGIEHAHNLFLQIGLDLGFPGLIAYLALLINTFVLLSLVLRDRIRRLGGSGEGTLAWGLAAGAAGGLSAMLAHGIFDAAIWNSRPAFLPWLLIVISVLVGLQRTRQDVSRNGSIPDNFASAN